MVGDGTGIVGGNFGEVEGLLVFTVIGAAWVRDTQRLQPWQRSPSFSLGRAVDNDKPASHKQAVRGEEILAEARSLGFKG